MPETQLDNVDETGDQVLDTADQVDQDSDDSMLDAARVLPGLTGGGVLLAGALSLGLQQRRRAQFRSRRPGRAIAGPPPELATAKMTINAAGAPTAATVVFMGEALRRLAEDTRTRQTSMPPLAAVQLHQDVLTLHLSGAADLPAPWEGPPDQLHWTCSTTGPLEDLDPAEGWAEAPYPMLVTIGLSVSARTRATLRNDKTTLNYEEPVIATSSSARSSSRLSGPSVTFSMPAARGEAIIRPRVRLSHGLARAVNSGRQAEGTHRRGRGAGLGRRSPAAPRESSRCPRQTRWIGSWN